MKRVQRHSTGSLMFDKRRKVWRYRWYEGGERQSLTIGTKKEFKIEADAWAEVERLQPRKKAQQRGSVLQVRNLVEHYRVEKMPTLKDTRRSYEVWLQHHILPRWGDCYLTDLQTREVELWLRDLELSWKSKQHHRGILKQLWDFAMWRRDIPGQVNPMSRVSIGEQDQEEPRSLTEEEFRAFLQQLPEPFNVIALLCACLGLRISEALGLKWGDWSDAKLSIQRSVVNQNVDRTKTRESRRKLSIHDILNDALSAWQKRTPFPDQDAWIFASPEQTGTLPWSYDSVWRRYQRAAKAAGLATFGTHSLRHSYRTWLSSNAAPVTVQQRLLRHADPSTTLRYGTAFEPELAAAHGQVVESVFNGSQVGRTSS